MRCLFPRFVFIFFYIDIGQKALRCDAMRLQLWARASPAQNLEDGRDPSQTFEEKLGKTEYQNFE